MPLKAKLRLRIPPVVLFLLALVAIAFFPAPMWAVGSFPYSYWVVALLVLFAVVLGLGGLWQFYQVRTTVNPHKPQQARQIVDNGLFAYTRNPMYLGLVCVLIAQVCWLNNGLAMLVVVAFVLYMTEFQIKPEEQQLADKFGEPYLAYCRQVRRWL